MAEKCLGIADVLPYQVKATLSDFYLKFLVIFSFLSNLGPKSLSCMYKADTGMHTHGKEQRNMWNYSEDLCLI